MSDTDLHDEHLRLTHALMMLFDRWQADHDTQIRLLGLDNVSPRSMRRHEMTAVPYPAECMTRVRKLLRLGRTIETMLPHNPDAAQGWMLQANRMFSGIAPLDLVIKRGEEGIDVLQNHLDGTSAWG